MTLGNTQGYNDPTLPHNPGGVELKNSKDLMDAYEVTDLV